jgi:zinc transporter, ZIP family
MIIQYFQLLALGAFAGFTIFLGLPLAFLQGAGARTKGFLNALSIGILVFLIVDVLGHAWDSASTVAVAALAGRSTPWDSAAALAAMFGGLAVGLLGLVIYESRFMVHEEVSSIVPVSSSDRRSLIGSGAYRTSMMIAIAIGAHNFSEGLAIGQSYAAGSVGLALLLIIGFGLHNTTEGFGIAAPLTGRRERPTTRFLAVVGVVGGGPTFVGTLVGSVWSSLLTYVLFLSFAGGALVYVSLLMYSSGRRQTSNLVLMSGILVGLCIGFGTDLLVTLGGA